MPANRSNILLIHSDQHRYDCLGANGHPLVQTPNLDALADAGTRFTQAYTPSPICSPARASLVTGTWPSTHGCRSIPGTEAYQPAQAELPTVCGLLHDAGYRQTWIGKFHGEISGDPTDHGVDHFAMRGDLYNQWRAEQGIEPKPWTRGPWGYFGNPDPHIRADQSAVAWEADQVIQQITESRRDGRPFMIRWDPQEPHLPCIPPEPFASMYAPDDLEPWAGFHDPLHNKPWVQAEQRRSWRVEGWPWEHWAPTVAYYLAEITQVDTQVGRLLAALEEQGLADDTLVIYTADHGDLCGDHGMMDKHFVMYDSVTRVPMLMRGPGVEPGAVRNDFVTSEIDLAATICAAARVEAPDSFAGVPLIHSNDTGRRDILSQYHGSQFGLYTQRSIRDHAWKYVWNATDRDELYHVESDAGEIDNLVEEPTHRSELARLRRRLVDWMDEIGDPMLNLWTRPRLLYERPPIGGHDLHTDC
ncbi:MAG: sulfatase-like hydrolase/transferase [Planctomycetota bacterium]